MFTFLFFALVIGAIAFAQVRYNVFGKLKTYVLGLVASVESKLTPVEVPAVPVSPAPVVAPATPVVTPEQDAANLAALKEPELDVILETVKEAAANGDVNAQKELADYALLVPVTGV